MPRQIDDLVAYISAQLIIITPTTLKKIIDALSKNIILPPIQRLTNDPSEAEIVQAMFSHINKFLQQFSGQKLELIEKLKNLLHEPNNTDHPKASTPEKVKKHILDEESVESDSTDDKTESQTSKRTRTNKRSRYSKSAERNHEYDKKIAEACEKIYIPLTLSSAKFYQRLKKNMSGKDTDDLENVILIYPPENLTDEEKYKYGLKIVEYIKFICDCRFKSQKNIIIKPFEVDRISSFNEKENRYFKAKITIPIMAPPGTVAIRGQTINLVRDEIVRSRKSTETTSQSSQNDASSANMYNKNGGIFTWDKYNPRQTFFVPAVQSAHQTSAKPIQRREVIPFKPTAAISIADSKETSTALVTVPSVHPLEQHSNPEVTTNAISYSVPKDPEVFQRTPLHLTNRQDKTSQAHEKPASVDFAIPVNFLFEPTADAIQNIVENPDDRVDDDEYLREELKRQEEIRENYERQLREAQEKNVASQKAYALLLLRQEKKRKQEELQKLIKENEGKLKEIQDEELSAADYEKKRLELQSSFGNKLLK